VALSDPPLARRGTCPDAERIREAHDPMSAPDGMDRAAVLAAVPFEIGSSARGPSSCTTSSTPGIAADDAMIEAGVGRRDR
jgi:hypothetical protein